MKQNKKSTTKSKKLKHKKIYKSTVPKGFVSLHTIIILLTSILAITISDGNNITASVVVDVPTDYESTFSIIEVSSISNLNQLNEGWYSIRNGHVFYLDKFDSYIPLYIKATNPPNLNGLLVIDSDGNIEFEENDLELTEQTKVDNRNGETLNQITGEVSGLEKVSGFATITFITLDHANIALGSGSINEGDEIVLLNDGTRYLAVNSGGSLTLSPISASSPRSEGVV